MRRPDILINVPLALLVLGGAACAKSGPPVSPDQTPAVVQSVITPVSNLISERRQRGLQLENLDFSNLAGREMARRTLYKVGKVNMFSESENYSTTLIPRQLDYYARLCGVEGVREDFYVQILDRVAYSERGETDGGFSFDGSNINIVLGIESVYRDIEGILNKNFEVDESRKSQATENLATIITNRALLAYLCAGAIASGLNPEMSVQKKSDEVQRANLTANNYRDQLLEGSALPFLRISPRKNPLNTRST